MKAVCGAPERCSICGGGLVLLFGQIVDDDGRRRPVIDPTVVQCEDCRTIFPTGETREKSNENAIRPPSGFNHA